MEQDNTNPTTNSQLVDTNADNNLGAKKILVVEDEEDARTIFMDLLSDEGYEVSGAGDGGEALAKAAADKYDLILLDIIMPNKDGIETLEEIIADKQKYGNPKVIMLTNISGDAAVEKAMEIGAVGYRLKSSTELDQLLDDVEKHLGGQPSSSAETQEVNNAPAAV